MAFSIDKDKFIVKKNEKEITLPKKEFEILCLLCEQPGKVFSRERIFKEVWPEKSLSKIRTVDVHILNIRKKLGREIIVSLKGVGYKCKCE